MTAHEILSGLLEEFRQAMPEVDFREAFGMKEASRMAARVCVTGAVSKESAQGDEWSAKLTFKVFLPRGVGPGGAEDVLGRMAALVKEGQPLFAGMERGAPAVDKGTGAVEVGCVFSFAKPESPDGSGDTGSSGGNKATYPVELDGQAYTVTGWKVASSTSGSGLTAVGESVPFYYKSRREFNLELQGLSMESPEVLDGFTVRLGGQGVLYTGCRWKSVSAGGNCTAIAGDRVEEE